jgi:hypothetical protein
MAIFNTKYRDPAVFRVAAVLPELSDITTFSDAVLIQMAYQAEDHLRSYGEPPYRNTMTQAAFDNGCFYLMLRQAAEPTGAIEAETGDVRHKFTETASELAPYIKRWKELSEGGGRAGFKFARTRRC